MTFTTPLVASLLISQSSLELGDVYGFLCFICRHLGAGVFWTLCVVAFAVLILVVRAAAPTAFHNTYVLDIYKIHNDLIISSCNMLPLFQD